MLRTQGHCIDKYELYQQPILKRIVCFRRKNVKISARSLRSLAETTMYKYC